MQTPYLYTEENAILENNVYLPHFLFHFEDPRSKSISPASAFNPDSAVSGNGFEPSISPAKTISKKSLLIDCDSFPGYYFLVDQAAFIEQMQKVGFDVYVRTNDQSENRIQKLNPDFSNIELLRDLGKFNEKKDYQHLATKLRIAKDKAFLLSADSEDVRKIEAGLLQREVRDYFWIYDGLKSVIIPGRNEYSNISNSILRFSEALKTSLSKEQRITFLNKIIENFDKLKRYQPKPKISGPNGEKAGGNYEYNNKLDLAENLTNFLDDALSSCPIEDSNSRNSYYRREYKNELTDQDKIWFELLYLIEVGNKKEIEKKYAELESILENNAIDGLIKSFSDEGLGYIDEDLTLSPEQNLSQHYFNELNRKDVKNLLSHFFSLEISEQQNFVNLNLRKIQELIESEKEIRRINEEREKRIIREREKRIIREREEFEDRINKEREELEREIQELKESEEDISTEVEDKINSKREEFEDRINKEREYFGNIRINEEKYPAIRRVPFFSVRKYEEPQARILARILDNAHKKIVEDKIRFLSLCDRISFTQDSKEFFEEKLIAEISSFDPKKHEAKISIDSFDPNFSIEVRRKTFSKMMGWKNSAIRQFSRDYDDVPEIVEDESSLNDFHDKLQQELQIFPFHEKQFKKEYLSIAKDLRKGYESKFEKERTYLENSRMSLDRKIEIIKEISTAQLKQDYLKKLFSHDQIIRRYSVIYNTEKVSIVSEYSLVSIVSEYSLESIVSEYSYYADRDPKTKIIEIPSRLKSEQVIQNFKEKLPHAFIDVVDSETIRELKISPEEVREFDLDGEQLVIDLELKKQELITKLEFIKAQEQERKREREREKKETESMSVEEVLSRKLREQQKREQQEREEQEREKKETESMSKEEVLSRKLREQQEREEQEREEQEREKKELITKLEEVLSRKLREQQEREKKETEKLEEEKRRSVRKEEALKPDGAIKISPYGITASRGIDYQNNSENSTVYEYRIGEVLNDKFFSPQIRTSIVKRNILEKEGVEQDYFAKKHEPVSTKLLRESDVDSLRTADNYSGPLYYKLNHIVGSDLIRLPSADAGEKLCGVIFYSKNGQTLDEQKSQEALEKLKMFRGDDDFMYAKIDGSEELLMSYVVECHDQYSNYTKSLAARIINDYKNSPKFSLAANPENKVPDIDSMEYSQWMKQVFEDRSGSCRHRVMAVEYALKEAGVLDEDYRVVTINNNHVILELRDSDDKNKWHRADLGGSNVEGIEMMKQEIFPRQLFKNDKKSEQLQKPSPPKLEVSKEPSTGLDKEIKIAINTENSSQDINKNDPENPLAELLLSPPKTVSEEQLLDSFNIDDRSEKTSKNEPDSLSTNNLKLELQQSKQIEKPENNVVVHQPSQAEIRKAKRNLETVLGSGSITHKNKTYRFRNGLISNYLVETTTGEEHLNRWSKVPDNDKIFLTLFHQFRDRDTHILNQDNQTLKQELVNKIKAHLKAYQSARLGLMSGFEGRAIRIVDQVFALQRGEEITPSNILKTKDNASFKSRLNSQPQDIQKIIDNFVLEIISKEESLLVKKETESMSAEEVLSYKLRLKSKKELITKLEEVLSRKLIEQQEREEQEREKKELITKLEEVLSRKLIEQQEREQQEREKKELITKLEEVLSRKLIEQQEREEQEREKKRKAEVTKMARDFVNYLVDVIPDSVEKEKQKIASELQDAQNKIIQTNQDLEISRRNFDKSLLDSSAQTLRSKNEISQVDNLEQLNAELSKNKNRNVLIVTKNIAENSNIIFSQCRDSSASAYYIDSPAKIDIGKDNLKIEDENKVRLRQVGYLGDFLKSAAENPTEKHILMVNWNAFSLKQRVALNTLVDDHIRTISGVKIPDNVQLIGLTKELPKDSSFLSRHNEVIESKAKRSDSDQPANTEKKSIDLEGFDNFKRKLFGRIILNGDVMHWEKSEFVRLLESGEDNFEIKNLSTESRHQLEYFFDQAKALGYLEYHGYKIPVAQNLNISFAAKQFEFSRFQDSSVISVSDNQQYSDQLSDYHVINQYLFDRLLYKKNIDNQSQQYFEESGLIEACPEINDEKTLRLFITHPLNESQYYCLFNHAQKHQVKLDIALAPNVSLPAEVKFSKKESDQTQATRLRNTANILLVDDANSISADEAHTHIINVEDFTYQDLIEKETFEKSEDSFRNFQRIESKLISELQSGKKVILRGEFAEDLLQIFEPIILGQDPRFSQYCQNLTFTIEKPNKGKLNLNYLGEVDYLENGQSKSINSKTNAKIIHEDEPNQEIDLENSAEKSQHFISERIDNFTSILENNSLARLIGHSGVGKSQLIKIFEDDLSHNINICRELSNLSSWAANDDLSNYRYKVLFIDEANIDNTHFTTFSALKEPWKEGEESREIFYQGEFFTITPKHKVVFASNPKSYGGGRNDQKLFADNDVAEFHLKDFPTAYIYEEILKKGLCDKKSTLLNEIPEDQFKEICRDSIQTYIQTNTENRKKSKDLGDEDSNELTVRELQEDVLQKIIHKIFSTEYPKIESDNFLSVEATKDAEIALIDSLKIRSAQKSGIITSKAVGLNGTIFSGGSGVGKSSMIGAWLDHLGIKPADSESSPDALNTQQKYYKIDANLPLEEKKKIITKAYEEGNIIWIDEINSCIDDGLEKFLNSALTGDHPQGENGIKVKPGFTMISSINEGMDGRSILSPAIKHRTTQVAVKSLQEYGIEDFGALIKHWVKSDKISFDFTNNDVALLQTKKIFNDLVKRDDKEEVNLRIFRKKLPEILEICSKRFDDSSYINTLRDLKEDFEKLSNNPSERIISATLQQVKSGLNSRGF